LISKKFKRGVEDERYHVTAVFNFTPNSLLSEFNQRTQ
jgi:hypothetical protein